MPPKVSVSLGWTGPISGKGPKLTPFEAARQKLAESAYFLQRLRVEIDTPDAFRYNFSAFLSASDSVIDTLRHCAKDPSIKSWFKALLVSDVDIKKLREHRNPNVHQQTASPSHFASIDVSSEIPGNTASMTIKNADGSKETIDLTEEVFGSKEPMVTSKIEHDWYFDDAPEDNVLEFAESTLARLEKLIEDVDQLVNPTT